MFRVLMDFIANEHSTRPKNVEDWLVVNDVKRGYTGHRVRFTELRVTQLRDTQLKFSW